MVNYKRYLPIMYSQQLILTVSVRFQHRGQRASQYLYLFFSFSPFSAFQVDPETGEVLEDTICWPAKLRTIDKNFHQNDFPGWGPRPKVDMSRPKWTHEGVVMRSKLHGLETRMNSRLTGHEHTKVWTWTHESLMNARWSGHQRTKVWTWTQENFSCVHKTFMRSCKTIVRSPDFRAFMSRLSCVHVQTIVRSPDFRAFMSRLCAFMSRPSCVHPCFQTV